MALHRLELVLQPFHLLFELNILSSQTRDLVLKLHEIIRVLLRLITTLTLAQLLRKTAIQRLQLLDLHLQFSDPLVTLLAIRKFLLCLLHRILETQVVLLEPPSIIPETVSLGLETPDQPLLLQNLQLQFLGLLVLLEDLRRVVLNLPLVVIPLLLTLGSSGVLVEPELLLEVLDQLVLDADLPELELVIFLRGLLELPDSQLELLDLILVVELFQRLLLPRSLLDHIELLIDLLQLLNQLIVLLFDLLAH